MNRGSEREMTKAPKTQAASMRPRFMNRGSDDWDKGERVVQLGFNEAPIHESGKSERWGNRKPEEPPASMRPRFMNRGSSPTSV